MVGLRNINMNKLKPCFNPGYGIFNGRRVVKVKIHLYAYIPFIVVYHVACIIKADCINFTLTELHDNRGILSFSRPYYCDEGFLIIKVKSTKRKVFSPRP